jgi:hypothetical protein
MCNLLDGQYIFVVIDVLSIQSIVRPWTVLILATEHVTNLNVDLCLKSLVIRVCGFSSFRHNAWMCTVLSDTMILRVLFSRWRPKKGKICDACMLQCAHYEIKIVRNVYSGALDDLFLAIILPFNLTILRLCGAVLEWILYTFYVIS